MMRVRSCATVTALLAVFLLLAGARTDWAAEESSQAAVKKFRAAAQLQNEGQFDLAADEYREFLKLFGQDPLSVKAEHYLGYCLIQQKKYSEAVELLEGVAEKHPDFELLDETYLNLGSAEYNLALASNKPEAFAAPAATYGKLIEKYPKSKLLPLALFNQGDCYYALKKRDAAAASYARLLEKFPQHALRPDALYALGETQLELKKPAEADASFVTFLKEFPDHKLASRILMHRGDALFEEGKYADAQGLFARAAARVGFDQADRATMRQAECLTLVKKYAQAAALFAAVPERFPKSALVKNVPLSAGRNYYLAGNRQAAVGWLKQAVDAGGGDAPQAAHWLARAYLDLKQPGDALSVVENQLRQSDKSDSRVDLEVDRADALYDLPERRGESVALYAAVATKNPHHPRAPQALYNAAWAAFNIGRFDEARGHAEAFLAAYPGHELATAARVIVADSLLNTDKPAEAATVYRELIDKNPAHADKEQWEVLLGWALRREKKFAEVVALLEPVAARLGKPQRRAEAFYLLGVSRYAQKQFAEARQALDASLAANSTWAQADEALLLLSRAERQLNDLKASEATIRRILAEMPNSPALDRVHYQLGDVFYARGDYRKSAQQYSLVLHDWPGSSVAPESLYWLGWSRLLLKDHAGATQAFSTLIDKHAGNELVPAARFARAKALRLSGKNTEAIADLEAFLKSGPTLDDKSGALLERGLAQLDLKKHAEAARSFESLLAENPKYAAADVVLYNLGWALAGLHREADSAAAFARLAKEQPESPYAAESLYHVGEQAYQEKKFEAASKAYATALKKSRRGDQRDIGEMASYKLAQCQFHLGRYGHAYDAFAAQCREFPEGELAADGLFMQAECVFKQEKYSDAAAAYKRSLDKPPKSKDFQALARLHAGQTAAMLKQWDESLRMLEECRDKFPDSPYQADVLYELGWAHQNQHELDKAAALYEQATGISAGEVGARARLMLGEVKFVKGDHAAAIRDFFKVFRTDYPKLPESGNRWKAEAAYEAARCFEALGKPDQALRYYQEVLGTYPHSQVAPLAAKRVQELKASS